MRIKAGCRQALFVEITWLVDEVTVMHPRFGPRF